MHYLNCLENVTDFEKSKKILEEKGLKIRSYYTNPDSDKFYPELYIVKYDKQNCDMSDQDVQKCRGLILSKIDNSVVCPVPPKSISSDDFASNFNSSPNTWTIQDFIDGTMINLFRFNGETYLSTRSCLNAKCKWFSNQTFADLFTQCLGSSPKKLDSLDMDYCYSFVIQHPDNTIVKKYLVPDLVLTCVSRINDNTVEFLNVHEFVEKHNLDFRVPTEFNFKRIEDIYSYVNSLSETDQGVVLLKNNENGDHIRTKIRNPKYSSVRKLRGNTNNKMYLFFELRQQGNGAMENYLKYFEDDRVLFDGFREKLYTFTQRLFQNYLDCFVNKNEKGDTIKNHKNIDFELKPLVAELHANYYNTRQKTTKNTVIQYLHNMEIPRILFVLNYKNRVTNDTTDQNQNEEN
jgi:hypothetical protein